jgi:hypothetical protein
MNRLSSRRFGFRPTVETLEDRCVPASISVDGSTAITGDSTSAIAVVANVDQLEKAPMDWDVVQAADSMAMGIEYGTGVYVGQDDASNVGGAADDLAGSFAWLEAYENLQAIRELQRFAELRHAFEDPLGGDANNWSLGNEPGDHGDLLDLLENPTGAGPGLPLGWGDGDGDPRDPQSMIPGAPDAPGPGEGGGGIAGALERVGWVSTKEGGDEMPSEILAEERTEQPDGSSTYGVAREYEDGTLEVHITRKSPDGTYSTTRIRISSDHTEYHYESTGSDLSHVSHDEARYYSPDGSVWQDLAHTTYSPLVMDHPLVIRRSGPLPAPRDERPDSEDPSWFSPLHPDAWATFLAWWTHRTGPSIGMPTDDFGTGPDDGSSSGGGSAAPRVGIDAVINPGDSGWSPSVPGATGGDGDVSRPDDPFPPPPASK